MRQGWVNLSHATIYLFIVSTEVVLGSPKLVTLFLFLFDLSQKSHFWNFFFKIYEKMNIKIFWGPRECRENWKNFEKKILFSRDSHFFLLNPCCTCSQLSSEIYNSFVAQNWSFDVFSTWKISILTIVMQVRLALKIYFIWA